MRVVFLLLVGSLAVLSAAALVVAADDEPPPAPQEKLGPGPEGLVLEASVSGKAKVQPGEAPDVFLRLRNESESRTIPVVLPGDGSESGWREPHVWWTAAQVLADGTERPLEPSPLGRCGMFDPEWQDEVVDLAAGESREMKDWMPVLRAIFDFQEAGRVRLVGHYAYRAGRAAKGNPFADAAPQKGTGRMGATKPFQLDSKPVEFVVERPLDVVAEVKGKVRAGKAVRLRDVLTARVVNRSGKPLTVKPGEWMAYAEVDTRVLPGLFSDVEDVAATDAAAPIALAADASTEVYGPASRFARQHVSITFAKPGTARVAVRLAFSGSGPRIRSAWVDLVVEE